MPLAPPLTRLRVSTGDTPRGAPFPRGPWLPRDSQPHPRLTAKMTGHLPAREPHMDLILLRPPWTRSTLQKIKLSRSAKLKMEAWCWAEKQIWVTDPSFTPQTLTSAEELLERLRALRRSLRKIWTGRKRTVFHSSADSLQQRGSRQRAEVWPRGTGRTVTSRPACPRRPAETPGGR